nr:Short-chain dehydrogenase reductase SDR domain containing protein [Haemonchus contortus]
MDIETTESDSFVNYILVVVVLSAATYLVRRYFKGAQFNERVSAKGLVAVVTGANSGIGLETVRGLNLAKAKVYMLCRNEERGAEAKIKLAQMGCDATRLINIRCDLADFSSIRECADEILKDEDKIDILICNAGVMFYPRYEKTVDGHEMTWQSNHLGHFLLTHLLLPAMEKAPKARIIIVSSNLHRKSKSLDLATIDDKKKFGLFDPYNRSKLANVMHARGLSRRLHRLGIHNVTVNSLHPGAVNSNLARSTPLLETPLRQITAPLRWFFLKTDRDGAQTSLYLALSKKVDGISGKYFADCKLANENPLALNDQACDDLYNYSMEQCGITD